MQNDGKSLYLTVNPICKAYIDPIMFLGSGSGGKLT